MIGRMAARVLVAGGCWSASLQATRSEPRLPVCPTYRNPIVYADYSDPDVLRFGKRYYLVASSFHFSPGIPLLGIAGSGALANPRACAARLDFAPGYDMVPPSP